MQVGQGHVEGGWSRRGPGRCGTRPARFPRPSSPQRPVPRARPAPGPPPPIGTPPATARRGGHCASPAAGRSAAHEFAEAWPVRGGAAHRSAPPSVGCQLPYGPGCSLMSWNQPPGSWTRHS
ncbi:hypothetical protein FCI23_51725 [Actinacidiphila oryziradicis]|uniref:Uncharacterized protein n=1 Tax=Actinacidiphila oryziradicis TaxID=2571141 RepID=A0A4U0RJH4_9ACTN|nr:hypothetical protein FCI23_51725 [Actinacidiphila oryziradicis]